MTSEASTRDKNETAILDMFADFCRRRSKRAVSDSTIKRYLITINILAQHHGLSLETVDLQELEAIVSARAKRVSKKTLSPATYNTELVVLRRWCEFHGFDPSEKQVRNILRLKTLRADDLRKKLTDADMLKQDDVTDIIESFYGPEWRAAIAVLWDTGCRIGELCSLNYSDVTRDEHGFVLHLNQSKTENRSLRLITPDIGLKYFQPYYLSHNEKGALFKMRRKGRRISQSSLRKSLTNYGKKHKKPLWPTLFRKSASTYWKKSGLLSDPAIRKRLGYTKDSKTFEQWYLQHGDDSQRNEELRALGIVKEIEVKIEPRKCWRCGVDIPDTEGHCTNCQAAVSGKTLFEDVLASSELEDLKFKLGNVETLLSVLVSAICEDSKLREHINALASKGLEPFIDLLE